MYYSASFSFTNFYTFKKFISNAIKNILKERLRVLTDLAKNDIYRYYIRCCTTLMDNSVAVEARSSYFFKSR